MWHKEKIALIGANGGLGSAFTKHLDANFRELSLLLVSRNLEKNQKLAQQLKNNTCQIFEFDASKEKSVDELIVKLSGFQPDRLFYLSGGGPFGLFHSKEWKDHFWSLHVTQIAPMRLIHHFLRQPNSSFKQIVYVGSALAENLPHPYGASYAAAKSAMLSLIGSINAENASTIDIRVFSPDYIDTEMLPKNAYPRRMNLPMLSADYAAQKLFDWSIEPKASWHYLLRSNH